MMIQQVKKVTAIFLICTAGAVILHLIMPLLLGIFVNGLSFAVPFVLYDLVVRKKWRIHLTRGEKEAENVWDRSEDRREEGKKEEQQKEAGTINAEDAMKNAEQRNRNPSPEAVKKQELPAEVIRWYQDRGKPKLDQILSRLYARGIFECWIRKDGICNILTPKGYRRAGSIPAYPGDVSEVIADLLRKDGLHAVNQGRYLYLSWTEE